MSLAYLLHFHNTQGVAVVFTLLWPSSVLNEKESSISFGEEWLGKLLCPLLRLMK